MKLGEIAERLHCRLEGDANAEIAGVAGIEVAAAGQLTFLANPRYRPVLASTRASAVLVSNNVALPARTGLPALALLRSENPYLDFARAIELFYHPPRYAPGIHPTAMVAPSARVGPGAHIGPYCLVDEEVAIGRNAVLHSFVSIYRGARIGDDFFAHSHTVVREFCQIGHRVILQNGAVVGGDGFGFAQQADGRWHKIAQSGIAVVEDDVEIQVHACVDRATVGETRLRRGAKLDDLVLVGHACEVGEDTLLCGQVGLAGSTRVGKGCILAGQVGVAGHLEIGDASLITSQSGVPNDLQGGREYAGSPVVEKKQWIRSSAALNHLPELLKAVRALQAEVARLRGNT